MNIFYIIVIVIQIEYKFIAYLQNILRIFHPSLNIKELPDTLDWQLDQSLFANVNSNSFQLATNCKKEGIKLQKHGQGDVDSPNRQRSEERELYCTSVQFLLLLY